MSVVARSSGETKSEVDTKHGTLRNSALQGGGRARSEASNKPAQCTTKSCPGQAAGTKHTQGGGAELVHEESYSTHGGACRGPQRLVPG